MIILFWFSFNLNSVFFLFGYTSPVLKKTNKKNTNKQKNKTTTTIKPISEFPTTSDTNRAAQQLKMKEEVLHYLCSENKGADQPRS